MPKTRNTTSARRAAIPLTPSELDNLMSTSDNAVVLFYSPACPHCASFMPVFESMANKMHRTNGVPGAVPIVFAKIDAVTYATDIDRLRPGFISQESGRGYPTILFKRGDGVGLVWPSGVPRTEQALSQGMAEFFGEPMLAPVDIDLWERMAEPNPEFVLVYSEPGSLVPRFVTPVEPDFVSQADANDAIAHFLLSRPELMAGGHALPVNEMDRIDINVPAVYVPAEDRWYEMRDCTKWLLNRASGEGYRP